MNLLSYLRSINSIQFESPVLAQDNSFPDPRLLVVQKYSVHLKNTSLRDQDLKPCTKPLAYLPSCVTKYSKKLNARVRDNCLCKVLQINARNVETNISVAPRKLQCSWK